MLSMPWIQTTKRFLLGDRWRKLLAFGVGFLLFFLFLLFSGQTTFYHDSSGYWGMSYHFIQDGHFTPAPDPAQMPELPSILFSLRGYFFSLLLFFFRGFQLDSMILYWICLSLFYAFSLAYVLPDLFEKASGRLLSMPLRLVPIVLLLFFWPGLVRYPLTDLPAFCFSILAFRLFTFFGDPSGRWTRLSLCCFALVLGFLLYALYNIRSFYLFSSLFLGIGFLLYNRKRPPVLQLLLLLCLLLGAFLSALPQSFINLASHQTRLPLNPLSLAYEGTGSMLLVGLQSARIETDIYGMLQFDHQLGRQLSSAYFDTSSPSLTQYIRFFLTHPIESIGIYFTHLMNSLDIHYGEMYITDHSRSLWREIKAILLYILWFFSFFGVSLSLQPQPNLAQDGSGAERPPDTEWRRFLSLWKRYGVTVLFLILPALLSIIFPTESRYFLPVHFVLFAFLSWYCPYAKIKTFIREHPVTFLLLFLFFLGVCIAFWGWTAGAMRATYELP